MAQFTGFVCDSCETIVEPRERIKKIVRYETPDGEPIEIEDEDGRGPEVALSGEVHRDLCPACVETEQNMLEEDDLKPLRRRRTKAEKVEEGPPVLGLVVDDPGAPTVLPGQ